MIHIAKKVVRNILGTIIILIGISGLVLPVIPGIVLIVLGFSILSFKNKDKVKEYIKSTFVGKKMLLIFYKLKSYS